MRLYFGLIATACVFAALCGTALTYDGSWYLYKLLDMQSPFVPWHRYMNFVLHWPVVIVSYVTSDLRILVIAFSLIYTSLPFLALTASWWIVRRTHRQLFVWVAAGLGLATLPGQIFSVGEPMVALPMFWPVLVAVIVGIPAHAVPVLIGTSIALFLTHPAAVGYFLMAACLAFFKGWRSDGDSRRLYGWGGVLLTLSAGKAFMFFLLRSPYETGEMSFAVQIGHFYRSATGIVLLALCLAWLAALLMGLRAFTNRLEDDALARRSRLLEVVCIVAAGCLLAVWARDPWRWRYALDFRNLAAISSFPFMCLAVVESLPSRHRVAIDKSREWKHRESVIRLIGIVFLVVTSIQSSGWFQLRDRLNDAIAHSGNTCIPAASIQWLDRTPLYHWSTPTYATLLQGQRPEKLVLLNDDCADDTFSKRVRIKYSEYRSRQGGWFDFTRVGLEPTALPLDL